MIDDLDTVLDGRLRLDGVDGMEAAGNEELTAQTEDRENFYALTGVPWRTEGRFSDAHLTSIARKKSAAHTRISKSSSRMRQAFAVLLLVGSGLTERAGLGASVGEDQEREQEGYARAAGCRDGQPARLVDRRKLATAAKDV